MKKIINGQETCLNRIQGATPVAMWKANPEGVENSSEDEKLINEVNAMISTSSTDVEKPILNTKSMDLF